MAIRWRGRHGERREFTYGELSRLSNRFANVLAALGVEAGERVFSLCPRVPELYVAALGTWKQRAVTSPLFRYGVSTRGGGLVEASLDGFRSMNPADAGAASQIVPAGADLLTLLVVAGGDTLSIRDWDFTPSADRLTAGSGPLTLTASRGAVSVELQYRFVPDNYLIAVQRRVTGLGPNGGTHLVGLGEGLRNTESDSVEHYREAAIVTKGLSESEKHALELAGQPAGLLYPQRANRLRHRYAAGLIFIDYCNSKKKIAFHQKRAPL